MCRAVLLLFVWVSGCAPPACSDAEDRRLHDDVRLLVRDDGPVGEAAGRRLRERGVRSIVHLESGLYAADPRARRRIVKTLAAIGSREASPILVHLGKHDPDPDVRAAAERALASLTHP